MFWKRYTMLTAAILVLSGLSSAYGLDGNDARRLHALIVADTADTTVGPLVDIDGRKFYEMITAEIPGVRRGPVEVLKGSAVTKENLLAKVDAMEVQNDDTVLCYFTGHGAFMKERGQVLRMSNGELLLRNDLLERLKAKNARLTVLITDACSNVIEPRALAAMSMAQGIDHDACRYLFFRHRGIVDLHAAAPGEEAVALNESGSIFTSALIDVINQPNMAFRGTPVTWREVVGQVALRTKEAFKMQYDASKDFRVLFPNQKTQTVKVASLGEPIAAPIPKVPWRLGIRVSNTNGQGVRIDEVFKDSQAEWAGFQVGEVLYRIETGWGNPLVTQIRNTNDFMQTFWSGQAALQPDVHKFYLNNPADRTSRTVKVRIRDISVRR